MEERNIPNRIDRLEQTYKDQLEQVVSAETVVPDTMPDLGTILFADARVFIRSCSLSEGALDLEGSVAGTVVYLPEESGMPQKINITVPLAMTARNERIGEDRRLLLGADIVGVEARAVNSRKVSFRAEVCADVSLYQRDEFNLSSDTGEIPSLEILSKETSFGFVRDISEKTFTVADDVDLPTSIEQILWYQTRLFAENAKKVGGKTILQGGVELQLMYLPPESETPCFESFRIPFSQLMDSSAEDALISAVQLRTVSSFVEILPGLNRSDSVSMELQLIANILYVGEQKLSYISDAYSLRCPLLMTCETLSAAAPYSTVSEKAVVKELLKLPDAAKEILNVHVHMSPCAAVDEGVKTAAVVCILYRTENAVRSVSKKLPVTFPGKCAGKDCLYCKAECIESYASTQNDGIELRIDAELTTVCADVQQVKYVSRLEADTAELLDPSDRPSVVAVRAGGRSLWELAKTYHSSVSLIESANAECTESDSLLLIPRGR